MERGESSRRAQNEDVYVGVHRRPEVPVSPPMREDGPTGRYVYVIGENLTPRYQIRSKLGKGSVGDILECWDRQEGQLVAIKVMKSTRNPIATNYEISVLQRLPMSRGSSSRYVQMRHVFYYRNHGCIVFEKLGPSLHDLLQKNNSSPVPVDLVRIFGRQLLESVAYLHDLGLIHTDLKPENILLVSPDYVEIPANQEIYDVVQRRSTFRYLPKSCVIKVCDFSSSIFDSDRVKIQHHNPVATTRNFRAPEVILGLGWTYPIDLWSIGCILAELCTGRALFWTVDELDLEHLAMLERVLGHLPQHMTQRAGRGTEEHFGPGSKLKWPEGASSSANITAVNKHEPLEEQVSRHMPSYVSSVLIDLLKGLLRYDPSERLTARQALQHPFLRNPH